MSATISLKPWTSDDERWEAVCRHQRAADGRFVFSVRTTGVYCRPICPSRRPLRKNVSFYRTWREAEAAGFRACKRCVPNAASHDEATLRAVRDACQFINEAKRVPSLEELATRAGFNLFHFHRLFTRIVGITPKAYASARCTERLRQHLAIGDARITDAIYDAGFASSSRAYALVDGPLGMLPAVIRAGGRGEEIRYAIAATHALGMLLVARTARGICAIEFGDDRAEVLARLAHRFPHAIRAEDNDSESSAALQTVARAIDGSDQSFLRALPLDLAGTIFQRRVWEVLRAIPAGETRTYTEIAASIGSPRAVRAVASACAANPTALAIPCHRAVRGDGGLGGYRWGVSRKHALLEREANRG